MDDHAVPIYKNPQPMNITFTIYRYPSETLGQLIKKLRIERGLEQRELARRLRVNKNSVCEWENDRKKPSRMSMRRLVKFFNIRAKRLEDLKMKKKRVF
jgi:DNA-binding transcriptional regulator YiaG